MDIFLEVRQVAAEVFDAREDAIALETSPQSLENWDSIQHLNFIMALESRFKVELSPEEMESIKCVGDAVKILADKQSNLGPTG